MMDLKEAICELIRLTSTDLPAGVEKRLREAANREEPGSAARLAMDTILANVDMARKNSTPICQDTGTPIFFVHYPSGMDTGALTAQIRSAVELATQRSTLRPNAVHSLTGKNSGNNLGNDTFPTIHYTAIKEDTLTIDLMLKGGGCENVGAQYSLPDTSLDAARDLDGVRKAVLDAVHRAQGDGCAPGFLGVAIGGDRDTAYAGSKEVLLRDLDGRNPDDTLNQLESRLTQDANEMGIGPMGFGGKTTVLGTRITCLYRLPASYFVTISYMCWAYRRRKMTLTAGQVTYE